MILASILATELQRASLYSLSILNALCVELEIRMNPNSSVELCVNRLMTDFCIFSALIFALMWAVVSDVFYRRIGNVLIGGLLFGWVAAVLLSVCSFGTYVQMSQTELLRYLLFSVAGALCVLLIGGGLFLVGQVGAGDIKLMSVLCLWVGYDDQLVFLMITALIGGTLALSAPIFSYIESKGSELMVRVLTQYPRLSVPAPVARANDGIRGVPYGVAISVGAGCFFGPRLFHVF